MKRNLCFLLCILLFIILPVSAANPPLTATASAVVAGKDAYLTLRFNETVVGDTVAVTYTWDKACLEPIPDACTWSKKGTLDDLALLAGSGVWTKSTPIDLKGDLCVLTFRVPENATFKKTAVNCTVLVKNNGVTVGEYKTVAKFNHVCDHQFGQWQTTGDEQHAQTCSLCKEQFLERHSWIDGEILNVPDNPNIKLKVLFCTVCKATTEVEVPTDSVSDELINGPQGDPDPGIPGATQPSQENQSTQGNQSTQNSQGNHNQGTQSSTGEQDQTEPNENIGTQPNAQDTPASDAHDHSATVPAADSHEGHDHEVIPPVSEEEQAGNFLIILDVIAALAGGAVYIIKKKH